MAIEEIKKQIKFPITDKDLMASNPDLLFQLEDELAKHTPIVTAQGEECAGGYTRTTREVHKYPDLGIEVIIDYIYINPPDDRRWGALSEVVRTFKEV